MSSKLYTTKQAANAVGVSRQTLQAWIKAGKVKAPKLRLLERVGARLWSESDVARLKRIKQRSKTGRPRKKKR